MSHFHATMKKSLRKKHKLFDAIISCCRSSHPEVFLGKGVLKICSKFTGEHPCKSVISIKLLCNFIETGFRRGCSLLNLPHIFRTPFPKNTSGLLLLLLPFVDSVINHDIALVAKGYISSKKFVSFVQL